MTTTRISRLAPTKKLPISVISQWWQRMRSERKKRYMWLAGMSHGARCPAWKESRTPASARGHVLRRRRSRVRRRDGAEDHLHRRRRGRAHEIGQRLVVLEARRTAVEHDEPRGTRAIAERFLGAPQRERERDPLAHVAREVGPGDGGSAPPHHGSAG